MKLKKGDTIQIISGKDRGKTAKIVRVDLGEGRLLAEGINLKKKHIKPRAKGKKGEIVEIPVPFPASIAMIICSSCKKPTRIGFRMEGEEKIRICKKCKKSL